MLKCSISPHWRSSSSFCAWGVTVGVNGDRSRAGLEAYAMAEVTPGREDLRLSEDDLKLLQQSIEEVAI